MAATSVAYADDTATQPAASSDETTVATSLETAERALRDAELLFDADPATMPTGDRDATLVMRDLALSRNRLNGAERVSANRLLARPGARRSACARHVCVHWTIQGRHKVARKDTRPRNGIPDYVDKVLKTMEKVHRRYVRAGYRAPKMDGGKGGSRKRDVYLRDVGSQGLYGYCTTDRVARTTSAYCVLDNNYSRREFPTNTPLENMRVTAAHEYYHAVQFAYDFFEDGWFMEATATWAEDELFDAVNDNVNYLPRGQLGRPIPGTHAGPAFALDEFWDLNHYGNWIFFRYLTERLRASKAGMPVLVRNMWTRASRRGTFGIRAVEQSLRARGRNFPSLYVQFADANLRSRTTYDEGRSQRYPSTAPRIERSVSGPSNGAFTLDHMTSASARLRPAASLSPGTKLNIEVEMPAISQGSAAIVTWVRSTGRARTVRVALNAATGDGSRVIPFDPEEISYVNLTLANTSTRFKECGGGDFNYSCNGTPVYDDRSAGFTVSLVP
jgi:hypothetical protein